KLSSIHSALHTCLVVQRKKPTAWATGHHTLQGTMVSQYKPGQLIHASWNFTIDEKYSFCFIRYNKNNKIWEVINYNATGILEKWEKNAELAQDLAVLSMGDSRHCLEEYLKHQKEMPSEDEPPLSKAGKDVVLHLPTDGVILDGRESTDDHAIVHYEWTLKQGDPSVDMKVPQPGTLKLSHLKEGVYIFQLTVTDTVGQRSSDNVSVSVLPRTYSMGGCSSVCSRYHFFCDNGCCIDITLACDGVRQCPDGSDEDFCQNLGLDRKMVTHTVATSAQPGTTGPSEGEGDPWFEKPQKVTPHNQPAIVPHSEKRVHSTQWAPESQIFPIMPDGNSSRKNQEGSYIFQSKNDQARGEHPAPEAGAVLPLALGLAITALLLLMVTCRLRLVKQKLKKARPITSEESDYLINGMYL
ncbi:low-density lipoprotein receptor-related protein 11, partial [Cricetulus griseus]